VTSLLLAALLLAGAADEPRIVSVRATADTIDVVTQGDAALAELAAYEEDDAPGRALPPGPIARVVAGRDRLYSKFRLVDRVTGAPIGLPRYVEDLPRTGAPFPAPAGKKGVTCVVDIDDAVTLGTQWVNLNVSLPALLDRSDPSKINLAYVRSLDREYKKLTDAGVEIVVVLNNPVPKSPDPSNPLIHPRTDLQKAPNRLGAFNVDDERGLKTYCFLIGYLAERYSEAGAPHGRIRGYIVGNEVQAYREWYNLGDAAPDLFVRHYARALRLTWLAVRRHHEDARVYLSMDHHWTAPATMRGDELLEKLSREIRSGGDFPWQVAFHPYPEDLGNPRVWKDTLPARLDARKISFKNLEVLPAFLAQERFLYRGAPRRILLSEQGFHCPDRPDGEDLQAAAYVYAWEKTRRLPTVDAFIYHRQCDHRGEGGLHLGLWSADPRDPFPSKPLKARKIHELFRAAGTPAWDEAARFAKALTGIADWSDLAPHEVH
jgi:hypothetical protein